MKSRSDPYGSGALREAAALFAATPLLAPLAAYCRLRADGHRKEALESARDFVRQLSSLPTSTQRDLALPALAVRSLNPDLQSLLPHPVREALDHVLDEWRLAEPGNPVPLRGLALLRADLELLRQCHVRLPNDNDVRLELVRMLLRHLDADMHHLSESRFLGDYAVTPDDLSEVSRLLAPAPSSAAWLALRRRHTELASLFADWLQYRQSPEGSFAEWCQARNRTHVWSGVVY